jgi:hypothetical protein
MKQETSRPNVVHQGRGGYVEIDGKQYAIEMFPGGQFCIHFPCGHHHSKLKDHLVALMTLAESKNPKWFIDSRTKLFKELSPARPGKDI